MGGGGHKVSGKQWYVATICGFVLVQANVPPMINSQGRELCSGNVFKTMFNIGMSLHAYEFISFKPGMITDMTNICILTPVLMTLIFIQGQRALRNIELLQSFAWRVSGNNPIWAVVDCIREMTAKKSCQCGGFGSLEHLLFLLNHRSNMWIYTLQCLSSQLAVLACVWTPVGQFL